MDMRAFRDSPAGRLVPGARGWAFVPHPLPPRLVVDVLLEQQIAAAGQALAELTRLTQSLADPQLLAPPLIRREATFSCRLAGRQIDLADLYACRAEGPEFADWALAGNQDEVREALALAQTLEWAGQRLSDTAINLRFIRELHAHLHGRTAPADFRNTQTWVGAPGGGLVDADYVPPPLEELQSALRHFEEYLMQPTDARVHPLVRLAFIFYQFEAIHPFLDANGRVGRLLLALLPCQWGLVAHPMLTMSAYFAATKQECDRLLLAVSREGDWRGWVLYCVCGVEIQAHDALRRMKALHRVHQLYRSRLAQSAPGRSPARLHSVPDRLLETPILTAGGLQNILEVNRLNAERAAQRLVDAGVLTPFAPAAGRPPDGVPRPPLYAAIELLNAIAL